MKRITKITVLLLSLSTTLFAGPPSRGSIQFSNESLMMFLNAAAILLALYIATSFLLSTIRLFLDSRLRRELIMKDASETMVDKILPKEYSLRQTSLRWCCLLVAIGGGLLICNYNQPLGLHSAATMSFSIAAGLLAYYLISKPKDKSVE